MISESRNGVVMTIRDWILDEPGGLRGCLLRQGSLVLPGEVRRADWTTRPTLSSTLERTVDEPHGCSASGASAASTS